MATPKANLLRENPKVDVYYLVFFATNFNVLTFTDKK